LPKNCKVQEGPVCWTRLLQLSISILRCSKNRTECGRPSVYITDSTKELTLKPHINVVCCYKIRTTALRLQLLTTASTRSANELQDPQAHPPLGAFSISVDSRTLLEENSRANHLSKETASVSEAWYVSTTTPFGHQSKRTEKMPRSSSLRAVSGKCFSERRHAVIMVLFA